jgi:hypothetical protein
VAQLCVNTVLATKVTLITDGIYFGTLRVKDLLQCSFEKTLTRDKAFSPLRQPVAPPLFTDLILSTITRHCLIYCINILWYFNTVLSAYFCHGIPSSALRQSLWLGLIQAWWWLNKAEALWPFVIILNKICCARLHLSFYVFYVICSVYLTMLQAARSVLHLNFFFLWGRRNPAYALQSTEAYCANPALVPRSSPEALHVRRRERPYQKNEELLDETLPVKFSLTMRLPRHCRVL